MARQRSERGGVAVLMAVATTVLVLVAALAVDLGMQRVARRDMQAAADVVAMDLSRELKGQSTSAVLGSPAFKAAVVQSVSRNDDFALGSAPTVLVEVGTAAASSFTPTGSLGYRSGDPAVGAATATVPSAIPNAVRVTADGGVDFAFTSGRGAVSRTAISTTQSHACFRVGSFAVSVDPSNDKDPESKLVDALLGDALDVTAVGYHGLADASISLAGLAADLQVGTPDQLAAVKDVSVRRLVQVAADVLERETPGASADVAALRTLAAKASAALDVKLSLDKLFNFTTGSTAALATRINVLDLVGAAAFVANGTNLLKTGVVWNEPALSQGEVQLQVIEAPRQACGPVGTAVSTSQVKLNTVIDLAPGAKVAGLTVVSATSKVPLTLAIDVAKADASLARVRCGTGTTNDADEVEVRVDRSSILASLDAPIHLQGRIGTTGVVNDLSALLSKIGLGSLLSILNPAKVELALDLSVQAGVGASTGATSATALFKNPPTAYGAAVPAGAAVPVALPLASLEVGDVSVSARLLVNGVDEGPVAAADLQLGSLLDAITSEILVKSINPLIGNINSVIGPVTSMLGVTATGADVFVQSPPGCDVPKLVG